MESYSRRSSFCLATLLLVICVGNVFPLPTRDNFKYVGKGERDAEILGFNPTIPRRPSLFDVVDSDEDDDFPFHSRGFPKVHFRNPFDDVLKEMEENMKNLEKEIRDLANRTDGGSSIMINGKFDPSKLENKTTSRTEKINGKWVQTNETTYSSGDKNQGQVFHFKTIRVLPSLDSSSPPSGTVKPIVHHAVVNPSDDESQRPSIGTDSPSSVVKPQRPVVDTEFPSSGEPFEGRNPAQRPVVGTEFPSSGEPFEGRNPARKPVVGTEFPSSGEPFEGRNPDQRNDKREPVETNRDREEMDNEIADRRRSARTSGLVRLDISNNIDEHPEYDLSRDTLVNDHYVWQNAGPQGLIKPDPDSEQINIT